MDILGLVQYYSTNSDQKKALDIAKNFCILSINHNKIIIAI